MRKRIWITCTIVLVVCLLLLLLRQTQNQKAALPKHGEPTTNQPSQPAQPKAVESRQTSNTSRLPPPLPRSSTPLAQALATTNPVAAMRLALWQAPIEFYGKVVDENSNAVAGAKIRFHWVEIPAEDGNRTTNTESDAEGLFSLHGQRGPSLTIWFSKEGYYSSHRGQKSFTYALGADIISPDPQNPVIFTLKKKGTAEPLVALKRNYRIPRDGAPVSINLVTGATLPGESGNLVVQCWTNDQGKRSGEKYDWRCVVAIPGGGIVPTDEELPFLAPESGYVPSAEIKMPADRPDWRNDVDLKFFYRLPDGRYGRMTFSMIAGGQHFCMIDSALNPTGSRNSEPAN
jgi:hypothetical protein